MKDTLRIFAIACCTLFMTAHLSSAQSLKDLFKKVSDSQVLKDVTESVTKTSLNADVTGTWRFSGSAVMFESDDLIKNTAASVAAAQIEEKMNEYLDKAGLAEGTFSYTFNSDSTFTTTYKKSSFDGRYSISADRKTMTLAYGNSNILKNLTMKATINVTSSQMDLMFNADKLLVFVSKITSTSSNSTLKTISSLTQNYDGMKLGMALKK